MGIHVSWDSNLDSTLHWVFEPIWTWTDFHHAFEKEKILVKEIGKQRHDSIAKFQSSHLPIGNAIGTVRSALIERRQRGNYGLTIICTNSNFIILMMNTLNRISPEFNSNFIAVQTYEEGYNLIKQSRERS